MHPLAPPLPCVLRSKLSLHLPHKVDDQRGRAAFDAKARVLSITLPIIRDLDGL